MLTQIHETSEAYRQATIVNPGDRDWKSTLFCFWFDCHAPRYLYVWGRGVEDALEDATEYLQSQGWIGYFSPPDYEDAAKDLGLVWNPRDDDAKAYSETQRIIEAAEVDHTYTEAGWLLSWEWGVDEINDRALRHAITMRSIAEDEE